ncbi:chromosome segregation protein SMC [Fibrobacteria bacterium R8-3-H12]
MKIQKLKIFGFKSFAQKVEIQLEGNGLTAIVGPNGCGKSNIVDAIRWVMGEQRAGLLRMDKMQGVIFSGTEERPAMSMAEVSLVIENDRGLLPSEYAEVMITRKAFSDGESKYLINNQECRLGDIKNLFADTGMGAGSYSQMDQRMVDALLSDKADERRTIFEEAAGVSKYKKQKKEAVSQLERVSADMERIAIELQHAKNQFKQQERMLARAQDLRNLKKRLKELDVSVSAAKYKEGKESMQALLKAKTAGETELGALNSKQTELETKIEEKRLLIAGEEEYFRECEKIYYDTSAEIAKLNSDYTNLQNREKELEENKALCEREINESEKKIFELSAEIDIETQGKKETELLLNLRSTVEDLRKKHREFSNKRLLSVQEQGKLQIINAEMEMLHDRIQQISKDIQNIENQMQEQEKLKSSKENESEESKKKSEMLAENINVLTNEKEALSETLESLKNQRMEAIGNKNRLEARLETLQSISENMDNLEGNKWLLNQKTEEGILLLSNQIEVLESKFAPLVEFCLGSSVQALLMQNQETVLDSAKLLSNENFGRALLAWNINLFEEKTSISEPDAAPLASLVKCSEKSHALLNSLLSKYFLAKDIETAAELAKKYAGRDLWFCTENCQAISSLGIAKVGKEQKENLGILQQNAEMKKLKTDIDSLNEKIESANSQISSASEKLQELSISISNATEEKQSADTRAIKANSEAEIAKASIFALCAQKEKNEQDISKLESRLQELKNSKDSNAELSAAGIELEQAEQEFAKTDSELQKKEQALKNQEDLVAKLASLLNRMGSAKEQIETINSKKELLKNDIESKAIHIEEQNEILSKKEKLRDAAREKYTAMAGDIEEWRGELREINSSLREKDKNAHSLELAMQDSSNALERIRERIFQEYEFDLEKEPAEQGFALVPVYEREANIEIHDLREKIKAIGPVATSTAEDFEAEREKMLSIEAQYNDLSKAKNSLIAVMERLDIVARDRFVDTFRKIQHNYQEVFASLMRDGEALLTMQNDLDPLEAEIEINARPTGKKMRGVRALSGGERALTATALLFALYMVKPSPYCILDEIDGPLDDANIGRFMALLRRFSSQTQFVIITHNKRTMAAADRLYGVTQEEKGVSKVGSVRLEDINE